MGTPHDSIFKLILMSDGWGIFCEIALRWQLLNLTGDTSSLVQVMVWCRQATSHYLSQCWPSSSMSPYDVTKPQWVNLATTWQQAITWANVHGHVANWYFETVYKCTGVCSVRDTSRIHDTHAWNQTTECQQKNLSLVWSRYWSMGDRREKETPQRTKIPVGLRPHKPFEAKVI